MPLEFGERMRIIAEDLLDVAGIQSLKEMTDRLIYFSPALFP
jgi:hypothetical protein